MASKRRLRRHACERKIAYADQTQAVRALVGLRARGSIGNHSYRCEHCGKWHIGHQPKRVRQSIADRSRQNARRG